MIVITEHAYSRRKRLGLSKKALERLSKKAYTNGISSKDTDNVKLKKYLYKTYCSAMSNNIKIYGEFVYIFRGNTLVTVYEIDQKIKKYLKGA